MFNLQKLPYLRQFKYDGNIAFYFYIENPLKSGNSLDLFLYE